MTMAANRYSRPSGLAEILDKGMVIDAFVRVSLVGIEVLTIDARIVVASVDTYLRYAEAVHRLDLTPDGQPRKLTRVVRELREGDSRARAALSHVKETASDLIGSVRDKVTGRHGEHE
ncbi:MAG TPA: gas vesicle protein GvpJ [Kofleriaceae bacterium]